MDGSPFYAGSKDFTLDSACPRNTYIQSSPNIHAGPFPSFGSKKEWVADQSAHIPSASTEITVTPDGERHTFTMPYTGLVVLQCYGVMFAGLNGFNMVNLGAGANGNICVSLYSKKGNIVSYEIGNPTTSEPQTCTSIRLTVANNLSIGGVSC